MASVDPPQVERARQQYRLRARNYDARTVYSRRYRERAVALLQLRPGDAVLDVACGTGVNFELIERRIGPTGRVVGVDASPDMLQVARSRVERHGYENVELIEAAIEEVELPEPCDAALFSLTHDVLQSPAAIERVLAALRPGARVASFGAKFADGPTAPVVNPLVRRIAAPFVTTFAGFDAPWRLLADHVPDLRVESIAFGGAYLASGTVS